MRERNSRKGSKINNQNIFSHVFAASSPVMEKFPVNVTSLDGQDVTFTCNAIGSPIPNTTWIFNGREMNKEFHFQFFSHNNKFNSSHRRRDFGNISQISNSTEWRSRCVKCS